MMNRSPSCFSILDTLALSNRNEQNESEQKAPVAKLCTPPHRLSLADAENLDLISSPLKKKPGLLKLVKPRLEHIESDIRMSGQMR